MLFHHNEYISITVVLSRSYKVAPRKLLFLILVSIMSSDIPNSIIHYLYTMSPYANRITWYLTLRNIPYAQCLQPVTMPRPDLAAMGVEYRRIPVLSIASDIYLDTRLILHTLEERFPPSPSSPYRALAPATTADQRTLRRLFEHFTVDAGIFTRMTQCIPPDTPMLHDPKFQKDREAFSGTSWEPGAHARRRPEALVCMRQAFALLEDALGDGRDWVLGTATPSLGDIEAVWPFDWLAQMEGAFPAEMISARLFPRTFSWMARFRKVVKEARESNAQRVAKEVKGGEALRHVERSAFEEVEVDEDDPTGLREGTEVQVWPIDSGSSHRDRGKLVGLTKDEVVISARTKDEGKEVRIHAPRWGFRIKQVGEGVKL